MPSNFFLVPFYFIILAWRINLAEYSFIATLFDGLLNSTMFYAIIINSRVSALIFIIFLCIADVYKDYIIGVSSFGLLATLLTIQIFFPPTKKDIMPFGRIPMFITFNLLITIYENIIMLAFNCNNGILYKIICKLAAEIMIFMIIDLLYSRYKKQ